MGRMVSCILSMIALACPVAAPAASEDAKPLELTYSPWTKICIGETCFVGREVRSECGLVAGAVLSERNGETKKTLRVTLPAGVNLERGVRIIVDQGQPVTRPYVDCYPVGCMADYQGGAELVDLLKQGHTLFLEGADAVNSPINQSLPLLGFAGAYDGPRIEPKIREALKLSQEEREQRKRAEEARKARCDAAVPLR
jgi:invasion protein IalB